MSDPPMTSDCSESTPINSELSSLNEDGDEEDKHTGSSMAAVCFNFINSIIGSGLIGMPFVLRQAGLGLGILLFGVVGLAADYSIQLLISAGTMTGTKSYQELMSVVFGPKGFYVVTILQFMLPFMTMMSYNVVIGDAITKVLIRISTDNLANSFLLRREFVIMAVTLVVTLPLSLYKDIGKLGKWSGLSILFTLFNVGVVYFRLFTSSNISSSPDAYSIAHSQFPQALGVLGIAIVCHHNSFTLYSSLSRPTVRRWQTVTHISVTAATSIMLVFALGGYLTFTGNTQGDILENFCSSDDLGNLARLAFAFIVMMTYPLDCFVAREVAEKALFGDSKSRQLPPLWYHVTLTITIVTMITLVSMVTDCVGVIMELNGVLVASPLAFLIPSICIIRLRWPKQRIFSTTNAGPLLLILLSALLSGMGIATVAMEIYRGVSCSHGEEMEYCTVHESSSS